MKPSLKRAILTENGKTVLRPMLLQTANGTFFCIKQFTGMSWQKWPQTDHYKTEAEAYSRIQQLCNDLPRRFIDDREINEVILEI